MIEHAVGVVSLERFAEISHMSHDEMGSLLLDTMDENAKLRELVRCLVYATHPLDRATLIANAAELGIEVD